MEASADGRRSKARAQKGSGRGPLITARSLRPAARGERRVLKAAGLRPAAAPVSTADASSRQTHAFHFPPFFPSFSPAPRTPDRTPRLPSARRPPAERAQRGSPETPEKGPGIPSRGQELGGSQSPSSQRGSPRQLGTHRGRGATAHSELCVCARKSSWSRGGETSNSHQAGLRGQRMKPEHRLFELSSGKKRRPGTRLKQTLD